MRTFIIRARKGKTSWNQLESGGKEHFEVVAHSVINAFFVSNDFRKNVDVYIVLDSSSDFPRTVHLNGAESLSLSGFHEQAVIDVIQQALKNNQDLQKDETRRVAPGVELMGFGFEKLLSKLLPERTVYLLEPKGQALRSINKLDDNPVFVLSDHLAMPANINKSLKRRGAKTLSLGKKMLFASQCIVLIHYETDLQELN